MYLKWIKKKSCDDSDDSQSGQTNTHVSVYSAKRTLFFQIIDSAYWWKWKSWLVFMCSCSKKPELSWRGGQKTDAYLWGSGWLTAVRHQSLCEHLWLRQQGNTLAKTPAHTHNTHTLSYTHLAKTETCSHTIRESLRSNPSNPVWFISWLKSESGRIQQNLFHVMHHLKCKPFRRVIDI